MIGLLRGHIARSGEDHVILETHGVGYLVHCDARTLQQLAGNKNLVELSIETQVREDAITLFGFSSEADQRLFKLLQNIQGVGARSALSLISALSADELLRAVAAQDKAPLTRASGVGPKLAGRIIAELKDRIAGISIGSASPTKPVASAPAAENDTSGDAIAALVQLGYGRSEVFGVVGALQAQAEGRATVESLIRDALRELAQ